jgi:hypothetical protein
MRVFLSSLVAFSAFSLSKAWVSPGRVTDVRNRRSTTIPATKRTSLKDVIDGNLQWYAGSTTETASGNVSKSAVERKLRNAAERFIKFQSGYFSPMRPNDNNIEMNRMNNNMNNGYYNNGYDSGYINNGYNSNNNNGYNNGFNNGFYNGYNNKKYYDPNDPSNILAEDFVFRSPVIGPLNKYDYIDSLDYFRVYEAFPDINPNCYGFTTDPVEPLKVRFFVKATGTYQKPLGGFLGSSAAMLTKPDGRQYMGSTEAWSITFNDLNRMQVKSISAGYVVDRFEEDGFLCTTDGKGLVYGILNTIGLDLPAAPGSTSLQLTQFLTNQLSKKGGPDALFPKANSDPRKIPQWWSDKRLGAKK